MFETICVFAGGGIGAGLRYAVSLLALNANMSYQGTFVINILGCLFIGLVTGFELKREKKFHPNLKLFLTTGIAGGFTTFSTFSFEAFNLIKSGDIKNALIYMLLSLFIGLLATFAGIEAANIFKQKTNQTYKQKTDEMSESVEDKEESLCQN